MSLEYSANLPNAQAQAHALVIGVNEYPHLIGGSKYQQQPAVTTLGLRQLTSPVASALAFVDWLKSDYRNPAVPLGTIELLLSKDNRVGATTDSAIFANIDTAFADWHQRCSNSKQNISYFYFCGHGLDVHQTVLLAEDFGASTLKLWENGIDFSLTYSNLHDLELQAQVFILDACRDQPLEAQVQGQNLGTRPLKSTPPASLPQRNGPQLKAAALGQKAHGQGSQVSFFTKALIECLRKVGASHFDGTDWVVTTDSLKGRLADRMKRTRMPGKTISLSCDVGGGFCNFNTDLHHINGPAEVMSNIGCAPDQAMDYAELIVDDLSGQQFVRPPKADPWELDLTAHKQYDFDARLTNAAPYTQVFPIRRVLVAPPVVTRRIPVT